MDITYTLICGSKHFLEQALSLAHTDGASMVVTFTSAVACREFVYGVAHQARSIEAVIGDPADVSPLNLAAALRKDKRVSTLTVVSPGDRRDIPGLSGVRIVTELQQAFDTSIAYAPISPCLQAPAPPLSPPPSPATAPLPSVVTSPMPQPVSEVFPTPIHLDEPDTTSSGAERKGSVVVISSAGGGSGKSTVCALAAVLAARAGVGTALVDFDLQFGDIDFLFGVDERESSVLDLAAAVENDACVRVRDFSVPSEQNLDLFLAPRLPEQAELVSPATASIIDTVRRRYQLVLVNTGSFWCSLQAELFEEADRCMFLCSPDVVSVRRAQSSRELCTRIGVPDARMVHVLNKWNDAALVSPIDVAALLRVTDVFAIPDGGSAVAELMGIGKPGALVDSRSPIASAVSDLLRAVLPELGVSYETSMRRASVSRRRRW